jgi:hypothetical protein
MFPQSGFPLDIDWHAELSTLVAQTRQDGGWCDIYPWLFHTNSAEDF